MIYYDNKEFSDELYRVYILKKYLVKYYGEEKAIKLIRNNDISKLAKSLGQMDISFFCLYFLQDIFVVKEGNEARELSKDHYEMWDILNKTFVDDEIDKLNIAVSRGFAKTTVCDLALSIWNHCYRKSRFTLLGAKKDDDATQFIDSIKKVFNENKVIIKHFGMLIDTKKYKVNANEIEFTNDTYIRAVGSASSVRGANWKGIRPTVIIADDFQDEKNILTDDAREKHWQKWCKEIEKCGDTAVFRNGKKIKSATKIISIGTVLHVDCLISKLSRSKDYETFLRRAVLLEDGQSVDDIFDSDLWIKCKKLYFNDKFEDSKKVAHEFYIKHKEEMKFPVLWEEKWDCFNDLAIPYWENRSAFMSEMMNDASAIGEKWFKGVRTQSKEEIENHRFRKTMLCIDPTATTNKKSDFNAMVVGSIATNGFKYMRKLILEKLSFDNYCKKVIELLLEFEDITHICIEKNVFSGADVVKIKELIGEEPRLRHRRFIWINEMQKKNKDEKISVIADDVNNGQIIFVDDNKDFTQQILDFQGQKYSVHDDAPDVVSECSIQLEKISKRTILRIGSY
ncbi:MAG: hypothetical protein ACRDA4_10600 [Filifactoraceae bacterium]